MGRKAQARYARTRLAQRDVDPVVPQLAGPGHGVLLVGLVQGVSEMFPVSSLGHSVLIPAIVGGVTSSDITWSASDPTAATFTPDGLPVGIQIVGRYRDEWPLLQLAHAFEAATLAGRRRPPTAEATNENLTKTHIKS